MHKIGTLFFESKLYQHSRFALFCIFSGLFLLIICFLLPICLFLLFHPSSIRTTGRLRSVPSCLSIHIKITCCGIQAPALTAQGYPQTCVWLRACLCMFVHFSRKNRCFRVGFLILATKRPVIVIVLLLWPKQAQQRDEGTEGWTEGPLNRKNKTKPKQNQTNAD